MSMSNPAKDKLPGPSGHWRIYFRNSIGDPFVYISPLELTGSLTWDKEPDHWIIKTSDGEFIINLREVKYIKIESL